jgi:hypothetical protein
MTEVVPMMSEVWPVCVPYLFQAMLLGLFNLITSLSLFSSPRRALNLGILRDPGSEVEDRQYQLDLQSINIGTAQWDQLKPEKEGSKGGVSTETERNSQNPALEWNLASR